jgi:hypothetical protein
MLLINSIKNLNEYQYDIYINNDKSNNDNKNFDIEIKLKIFEALDNIMELKDLEYYYLNFNNINSNFLQEIKYMFLNLGILDIINSTENLNMKFNNEELFSYIYCLRQKFS